MNQSKTIAFEDLTVGEIVADNYHTAGVFRQHGLDFCCGGEITLKKACEENNLDTQQIINELKQTYKTDTNGYTNYKAWEPGYLIDYIIDTHHRFVRLKTEEISTYVQKVASVHGRTYPENIEIYHAFCDLASEMLQHLQDEEETVFPLIKQITKKRKSGSYVSPEETEELKKQLNLMVGDHDGAGQLILKIRKLSNNFTPPEGACATYCLSYLNLKGFEADLHKHVHLENNILFKKAEELISG